MSRRVPSIAERVLALLPTLDQITSAVVAARLGVTENSAGKVLRQLERAGALVAFGDTHGRSGYRAYGRKVAA